MCTDRCAVKVHHRRRVQGKRDIYERQDVKNAAREDIQRLKDQKSIKSKQIRRRICDVMCDLYLNGLRLTDTSLNVNT